VTRADAILAASLVALRDAEELAFGRAPTREDRNDAVYLGCLSDRMAGDAMACGADPRRVNEWMAGAGCNEEAA
jgi:hypothetical protein